MSNDISAIEKLANYTYEEYLKFNNYSIKEYSFLEYMKRGLLIGVKYSDLSDLNKAYNTELSAFIRFELGLPVIVLNGENSTALNNYTLAYSLGILLILYKYGTSESKYDSGYLIDYKQLLWIESSKLIREFTGCLQRLLYNVGEDT